MTPTDLPAPTAAVGVRAWPVWRAALRSALATWAAAALAYALITCLLWTMQNQAGPTLSGGLDVWHRWDTGHYVTIAEHGYSPVTENPAFFPLYPMVMRALDPVLPGGMLAAGLIVANLFAITALTLAYRLVDDLLGRETASRTTFYLVAYPFAFYLFAAYPHGLFLTLALGSLYLMRRGDWWLAGALAGLSSGARQAGVLLALAFAVEYLRQRDWRWRRIGWDALAVLLVPTGLLGYAGYLWRTQGDPLRFMHVQSFWGRKASWPWDGVTRSVEQVVAGLRSGLVFQAQVMLNLIDLLAIVVTLTLLVLALVGPWKLGPEALYLTVFGAACFVMVILTPLGGELPVHGTPRYALEVLPAFIVLARIGHSRRFERFFVVPAMALQGMLLVAFFNFVFLS